MSTLHAEHGPDCEAYVVVIVGNDETKSRTRLFHDREAAILEAFAAELSGAVAEVPIYRGDIHIADAYFSIHGPDAPEQVKRPKRTYTPLPVAIRQQAESLGLTELDSESKQFWATGEPRRDVRDLVEAELDEFVRYEAAVGESQFRALPGIERFRAVTEARRIA